MPTRFAERHALTDVCILVADVERSVRFYTEKLGFTLQHRAPGFADFSATGLTLALWEIDHIAAHCGVSAARAPQAHKVLLAVKLPAPADVDACYAELLESGVAFQASPADYPWNARACYFAGPDAELWELYAWLPGGAIGDLPHAQ
ncbi:MAG: VOC family protein [Acetobacteraceae bacterium]